MKKCHLIYPLLLLLPAGIASCEKKQKGCTDPTASNFSIHADEDDGSCIIEGAFEGQFIFSGMKTTNGTSSTVTIPFTLENLGDNKFKISGFDGCDNIRLRGQNSQMILEASDCNISNWQFFLSSFNTQMIFTKFVNGNSINYNGQAFKQ